MTLAAPITRDTLRGAPATRIAHVDLARGGTIDEFRCDAHPRLVKHAYRGTRDERPRVSWIVDDLLCADLDMAIRALNGPVIAADLFAFPTAPAHQESPPCPPPL